MENTTRPGSASSALLTDTGPADTAHTTLPGIWTRSHCCSAQRKPTGRSRSVNGYPDVTPNGGVSGDLSQLACCLGFSHSQSRHDPSLSERVTVQTHRQYTYVQNCPHTRPVTTRHTHTASVTALLRPVRVSVTSYCRINLSGHHPSGVCQKSTHPSGVLEVPPSQWRLLEVPPSQWRLSEVPPSQWRLLEVPPSQWRVGSPTIPVASVRRPTIPVVFVRSCHRALAAERRRRPTVPAGFWRCRLRRHSSDVLTLLIQLHPLLGRRCEPQGQRSAHRVQTTGAIWCGKCRGELSCSRSGTGADIHWTLKFMDRERHPSHVIKYRL